MSGQGEDAVKLRFARPPALWPAYALALCSAKPALAPPGLRMPSIEAQATAQAQAAALAAYRQVCGFSDDGALPLTYPHVLAMPLHMAMLTAPAFPVRLLGLVHVGNHIARQRRIAADEKLDLRCVLPALRESERGQEFELVTQARSQGELVWSETSLYLARRRIKRDSSAPPGAQAAPRTEGTAIDWQAPKDIGRRYARISGDRNPIHLSAFSARLFGFPRAIAHGMWSLARVVAEIEAQTKRPLASIAASFKLPILLPATVHLFTSDENEVSSYSLMDGAGIRPYLTGTCNFA